MKTKTWLSFVENKKALYRIGFEPMTYALPWRDSTAELIKGPIWFLSIHEFAHFLSIHEFVYFIYTKYIV